MLYLTDGIKLHASTYYVQVPNLKLKCQTCWLIAIGLCVVLRGSYSPSPSVHGRAHATTLVVVLNNSIIISIMDRRVLVLVLMWSLGQVKLIISFSFRSFEEPEVGGCVFCFTFCYE